MPLPAALEQQITDHRSLSRYQLHWQAGKLSEAVAELALRFSYFSLQLVQLHSSSF